MQEGASDKPGFEFRVRSSLSELIFLIVSHMPAAPVELSARNLRDNDRIRQMLQYISDHFADPLTINDIADSASVSVSECLRCFHNTIELSPIQYLKQYRIQKAAELLLTSHQKIGDIAEVCGFFDISYFNRVFRAEKGVTPGQYRKEGNHTQ